MTDSERKKRLFDALAKHGSTVSTAESCTGGMIGQTLTSIPGISQYYGYGFVTYSNEAKVRLLGVKEGTLEFFGAVSAETVTEMAEGALKASGSDIAVSVSGIAGPGGGTAEKPVGTVYVGIAQRCKPSFWKRLTLDGDRDSVRQQTVNEALELIIKELE